MDEARAIPQHVAIIMDGNGRWARARALPRIAGHKQGVDALRRILRATHERGIKYLTLFAFSSENWQRPQDEVSELMNMLRFYLRGEIANLHKDGVKIKIIGDRAQLSADIQQMIKTAEDLTTNNDKLVLTIALSYGGRDEIVRAAQKLAAAVAAGNLSPQVITPELFSAALDTAGMPDPDLIIRTSGEKRISNFLLWQSAYTEFVFTDTLWPEFTAQDLELALSEYAARERRYGKLKQSR